ncbi:hypothetical protein Psi02_20390 [Planotetraspora silvatica]|uniref:Uncharacterized protein n=1 Tax=Planotetraspora silvatica TaxID=234614 RepID=A0A8J3UW48_9ACTN|nr:hypothetical protein Psi02_20390 [Planotetraspora silvatica]
MANPRKDLRHGDDQRSGGRIMLDEGEEQSGCRSERLPALILAVGGGQVEIWGITVSDTYSAEARGAFGDSSRVPRQVRESDGVGIAGAHNASISQNTF